jgi:murein DD-endopeptidase MepM/ murein hydrolase activator NlpD
VTAGAGAGRAAAADAAPGTPGGAAAPGALPTYTAPLDGPLVVMRPFDGPPQPWAPGHRGVDLAARPGQVVRAPGPGVVTFAGTVVDRGVVTVTHDDGHRSSLEPVTWSVRAGDRLLPGAAVGTVQDVRGHCAPAACLHWGLRRGDAYLDPMAWVVGPGPVVLLPEE